MNLRGLDLNLLPVFEAVYSEGGITRASERLNLTQPAVSNALARLRSALGDPLFVRSARGMTPTPAAQAMIGPVREALGRLRSGLDRSAFDPTTSQRVFSIAAGDIAAAAIIPVLARMLETMNATVGFNWQQVARPDIPGEFASGRLELAIDIPALARPELDSVHLMSDRYVCALRSGHPSAEGKFTLAKFLALRHITVSGRRTGRGVVDVALSRIGKRIAPVMRMPHFQPAFHAVMASELALVAPLSLARQYDVALPELPPQLQQPELQQLQLLLHARRDAASDAGLAWAKTMIAAAVAQTQAAAPRGRGGRGRPARERQR